MIDLEGLLDVVRGEATGIRSSIHGEQHWKAVARAGLDISAHTPGADRSVVFLFALFHDAMRENDGHDPRHGARAAAFVRRVDPGLHGLGERVETLAVAGELHADGEVSGVPTIGACRDADRLNLWRVHIVPSAELLSTAAAREPRRMAESLAYPRGEYDWAELAQELG
jgi:uncharacterized protein